jgi:hypothetical protein
MEERKADQSQDWISLPAPDESMVFCGDYEPSYGNVFHIGNALVVELGEDDWIRWENVPDEELERRLQEYLKQHPGRLPSDVLQPYLVFDGAFGAVYGKNPTEGIDGWGQTEAEAIAAFNRNWFRRLRIVHIPGSHHVCDENEGEWVRLDGSSPDVEDDDDELNDPSEGWKER